MSKTACCCSTESRETAEGSEREWEELNTGEWWRLAELALPLGALLLPLILYLDGTWLSANGAHTIKPFMLTIGNFLLRTMNRNEAKKLVCYMPDLGGSEANKTKVAYKSHKRAV